MNKLVLILGLFLTLGVFNAEAQCTCGGSCSEVKEKVVKAYYFHATRRCATCMAVESVTKETVKEYNNKSIQFISLNIEDKKNKEIMKKYKVGGQTLLFVSGNKTENLTSFAFMNARTKPAKLKAKIQSTIDSLKK